MSTANTRSTEARLHDILRRKHLSVTESRKKILSLFLEHPDALAHGDIEKKAGEKFDRVTIYRTLQAFEEKGIIHTIPTADNSIRYALCKDCDEGHHHDEHVHFVCRNCGKIACLDDTTSPQIDLPEGYMPENIQVVINGVCRDCSRKGSKKSTR